MYFYFLKIDQGENIWCKYLQVIADRSTFAWWNRVCWVCISRNLWWSQEYWPTSSTVRFFITREQVSVTLSLSDLVLASSPICPSVISSTAGWSLEKKVHVVLSHLFWSSIAFRQGRMTSSPTLFIMDIAFPDTIEKIEEKFKTHLLQIRSFFKPSD